MAPFLSNAQRKLMFAKHPAIAKRWAKEYPNQGKLPEHVKHKRKPKPKFVINNKMKGDFGAMTPETNKTEINLKQHMKKGKLDKAELASTIKHELLHVKHPKMTEKEVYKKSAKTKIPPMEQHKLIAKLKNKTRNYKVGALKRKFKLGSGDTKPGEFISKVTNSSPYAEGVRETVNPTQVGIRGLI